MLHTALQHGVGAAGILLCSMEWLHIVLRRGIGSVNVLQRRVGADNVLQRGVGAADYLKRTEARNFHGEIM